LAPYCQCCAVNSSTTYWLRSNVTPLGVRGYTTPATRRLSRARCCRAH
jgi:hypothetical protein